MSTPLTDSINALTAYANEVTGASDTNLSDAVHTLAGGYGGSALWKTVTLEEDHTRDAVGVPTYWKTFFGLDNEDFDNNYFCAFFGNNTAPNYACDFILWTNISGSLITLSVRQNWTNAMFTTGRSLYASSGTVIKIYKLPK